MLTGRSPEALFPPRATAAGAPRLQLRGFSFRPRRPTPDWRSPDDVTLTVRAGEIVGLVGLLGSGRTELLQTLYGAAPPGRSTGRLELDGVPAQRMSIRGALRRGIGFVPDDRRGSGLIPTLDVASNLALSSLPRLSVAGVVRASRLRTAVAWAFEQFGIRASSPTAPIMSLSGGNQQKVLIGRTLLRQPKLLLLDEPTRGVDVGAKADIYRLVRSLTEQGLAVLVASSELAELSGWCDRLVVLRDGHVVADHDAGGDPDLLASLALHPSTKEQP
jgi:ribose transport system ATP-binding protein